MSKSLDIFLLMRNIEILIEMLQKDKNLTDRENLFLKDLINIMENNSLNKIH